MSLSALAAAISPYVYGSSTIGVKKSTVCTSAGPPSHVYTPASSEFRKSIRIRGSCCRGMSPSTWASSPAASLLAQPAHLTISVSRFCLFRKDMLRFSAPLCRTVPSVSSVSSSLARAPLSRARDELVQPIELGFGREIDLECTSLAAPHDPDLCAEREAHAIFGRTRVDVGARRLALRLRR